MGSGAGSGSWTSQTGAPLKPGVEQALLTELEGNQLARTQGASSVKTNARGFALAAPSRSRHAR